MTCRLKDSSELNLKIVVNSPLEISNSKNICDPMEEPSKSSQISWLAGGFFATHLWKILAQARQIEFHFPKRSRWKIKSNHWNHQPDEIKFQVLFKYKSRDFVDSRRVRFSKEFVWWIFFTDLSTIWISVTFTRSKISWVCKRILSSKILAICLQCLKQHEQITQRLILTAALSQVYFQEYTHLKTNEYPLRIGGRKMKFTFGMVPLQGTC